MLFAYLVKKAHPDYEVVILEASDRILKRVLVSGNGRANFFNAAFLDGTAAKNFSDPAAFNSLISPQDGKDFLNIVENDFHLNWYKDEDGRIYPFSNTSSSLRDALIKGLIEEKVIVKTDKRVDSISPLRKVLRCGKEEYPFDSALLALGGSAYDRKEGANIPLMKSLELQSKPTEPGLCPLVTDNIIPDYLAGCRLNGILTLFKDKKAIYTEPGELLFKKDGISGICVFDASLFINQKETGYSIQFDPFEHDGKSIAPLISADPMSLEGSLPYPVVKFLVASGLKSTSKEDVLSLLTFRIKDKYPLANSQISLGGLSLNEIRSDFSLQAFNDIYVGGEELDLHAICGGFNMGFSFLSAMKAAKAIK